MGNIWYRFVRAVVRLLVRLLARHEVVGLENLPKQGPYLIISNHLSIVDPALLLAALPMQCRVLAGSTWRYHPIFGPLLGSLGAIWVRRGEVDREALRKSVEVLQQGEILGLAPEGTRSRTGGLQRGKTGTAYLAARIGVPIVPVAVIGTDQFFRHVLRLRRAPLKTVIGAPFHLPPSDGRLRSTDLDDYTDLIMLQLARLLPEQYRGVYKDDPRL